MSKRVSEPQAGLPGREWTGRRGGAQGKVSLRREGSPSCGRGAPRVPHCVWFCPEMGGRPTRQGLCVTLLGLL